jgi:hypothetical protein
MTACTITNIIERTDDRTGLTVEDFPTSLSTGNVGLVEMILLKPICIETFFDYPSLGRIILRDLKQTIAVGVVVKVTKSNIKDMKSLLKTQTEEKKTDEREREGDKITTEGCDSFRSLSNKNDNEDTIDGNHGKGKCSPEASDAGSNIMEPTSERIDMVNTESHADDTMVVCGIDTKGNRDSTLQLSTNAPEIMNIKEENCDSNLKLDINLPSTNNDTDDCVEEDI